MDNETQVQDEFAEFGPAEGMSVRATARENAKERKANQHVRIYDKQRNEKILEVRWNEETQAFEEEVILDSTKGISKIVQPEPVSDR